MQKLFYPVILCAVMAGCASAPVQQQGAAPKAPPSRQTAVAQKTRTYALGRTPDQDREQAFQDLLDSAIAQAAKQHAGDKPMEIGFSYSMTPRGAVYSFSEVEVSCLVQAPYAAGPGRELCAEFFRLIDSRINKIAGE